MSTGAIDPASSGTSAIGGGDDPFGLKAAAAELHAEQARAQKVQMEIDAEAAWARLHG